VPTPSGPGPITPLSVAVAAQAIALVGAAFTGVLARKRRQQLEATNEKLRRIAAELRRQREEDGDIPSDGAYIGALQRSLEAPSAAHPVEAYGGLQLSLARARRQLDEVIRDVKVQLRNEDTGPTAAAQLLPRLAEAGVMAGDIKDQQAQRAVARLRARALRKTGDLEGALGALREVLALSAALNGGDEGVDAEMGDFEEAGKYYDQCIAAINGGAPAVQLSSTWDT